MFKHQDLRLLTKLDKSAGHSPPRKNSITLLSLNAINHVSFKCMYRNNFLYFYGQHIFKIKLGITT